MIITLSTWHDGRMNFSDKTSFFQGIKKGRYTYEMRTHLKKAISQHKEKVQTNSFNPQTIISPEASLVLRPRSEAEVEYFQTEIGVDLTLNTDRTLKPHSAAEVDVMMVSGTNVVDWDGTAMNSLIPQVDENPVPSASEQQNQIGVSIFSNS